MNAIKAIALDPAGYVVLYFDNFEARADFMKCVPSGDAYGLCRPSSDGVALAWRLADLPKTALIISQE